MQKNTEQSAFEQQLFALMAVTEEQQNTTRLQQETIKKQQKQTEDLQQQLQIVLQTQCNQQSQQHAKFLQEQHQLFNHHHEKLDKLINWRHLFIYVGITLILCGSLTLGTAGYLYFLGEKIVRANSTLEALKLLDADIKYCNTVEEIEPLPCVRVRTELGGRGKDKSYWVIDQE